MSCVYQMVYGSTAQSAGYSLLAKSRALSDELCEEMIQHCESYDEQKHSAPIVAYSISVYRLSQGDWVLAEIYGNWRDQMGRRSRVIRNVLINEDNMQRIAHNPFLLLSLLPSVKKCLNKKRNEILTLPDVDLSPFSEKQWEDLWWKEVTTALKHLKKMTKEQKSRLFSLVEQKNPFAGTEIVVDEDHYSACRTLALLASREKRQNLQCHSFCLNQKEKGLCFRYRPYCKSPQEMELGQYNALSREQKLNYLSGSLPHPYNFRIMAHLWCRETRLWAWFAAIFTGMLFSFLYCLKEVL